MPGCATCSCREAAPAGAGSRVLLATRVQHNLVALRAALREAGATVVEPAPGLLEARAPDAAAALRAARRQLSSVEAAEVRAVVLGDEDQDGAALLAAALAAPTLAQLTARVEHADLLPLFADELGAFRSVYQPIVSLGRDVAGEVVGYEALLRAQGPQGPVMPDELFAAAADAGWLHVLDRVGRTTALRGAAGWLGDDLLFVNFLPTTIYRPEVCLATTERAALLAGLRLDQLVFEVTESERVADVEHLADVFAYYRERGCRVALDDLGAGYSSLNLLVRLQPDVVKLDKEIVQRLPEAASSAVIAAIVDITHAYGGLVLAECVETEEQAAVARDLGVDLGQGWYFGRPEERSAGAGQAVREPRAATPPSRPAATAPSRPATTPPSRPATSPTSRPPAPAPADTAGAVAHLSTGLAPSGNDPAVLLEAEAAGPGRDGTAPRPPRGPSAPPPATEQGVRPERGGADVEALVARAVGLCAEGVTIVDALDPELPLVYVNAAFERLSGYPAAELLGRNCRLLQGPSTDAEAVREIGRALREGREHVGVLRNHRRDGVAWWNELRLSPVHDASGRVTHYFGFQSDVTVRVETEARLAHLMSHDVLTGLPHRGAVVRDLERALVDARAKGLQLAVLSVGLDGFKAVNDALGHAAGDLALIAAGARLRGALREDDLLGRQGGDEFVAVLCDVRADLARRIAQRAADAVQDSFHSPLSLSGQAVRLGASIGVALFPDHGRDATGLLQAADRALSVAKASARGQAVLAR